MSSTKKSQELAMKVLRDLASLNDNRFCFDCNQRGPTYVNISIGSFVCTACGGALRKYNQRIKSISMSNFSSEEINFIKRRGNKACQQIYMALFKESIPTEKGEYFDDFLRQKYDLKKWYREPGPEIEKASLVENEELLSRLPQSSVQKTNQFGTNATSGLIIMTSRPSSSITNSTPSLAVSSKSSADSLSNISCPGLPTDPVSVLPRQQIKPIPPPDKSTSKPRTTTVPFSVSTTSKPTSQPIVPLTSFASFDSLETSSNPFSVFPTATNPSEPTAFSTGLKNGGAFFNFSQSHKTVVCQAVPIFPPPVSADKYAALAELDGQRKLSDYHGLPVPSQVSPTCTLSMPNILGSASYSGTGSTSIPPQVSAVSSSGGHQQAQILNPFKSSTSAFSPPLIGSQFEPAMGLPRMSTLNNPFITGGLSSRAATNPFLSAPSHSSQNPFINSG